MNRTDKNDMEAFLDFKEAERGENSLYDWDDDQLNIIADLKEEKPNVYKQKHRNNSDGTLDLGAVITTKNE